MFISNTVHENSSRPYRLPVSILFGWSTLRNRWPVWFNWTLPECAAMSHIQQDECKHPTESCPILHSLLTRLFKQFHHLIHSNFPLYRTIFDRMESQVTAVSSSKRIGYLLLLRKATQRTPISANARHHLVWSRSSRPRTLTSATGCLTSTGRRLLCTAATSLPTTATKRSRCN